MYASARGIAIYLEYVEPIASERATLFLRLSWEDITGDIHRHSSPPPTYHRTCDIKFKWLYGTPASHWSHKVE